MGSLCTTEPLSRYQVRCVFVCFVLNLCSNFCKNSCAAERDRELGIQLRQPQPYLPLGIIPRVYPNRVYPDPYPTGGLVVQVHTLKINLPILVHWNLSSLYFVPPIFTFLGQKIFLAKTRTNRFHTSQGVPMCKNFSI